MGPLSENENIVSVTVPVVAPPLATAQCAVPPGGGSVGTVRPVTAASAATANPVTRASAKSMRISFMVSSCFEAYGAGPPAAWVVGDRALLSRHNDVDGAVRVRERAIEVQAAGHR